MNDRKEELLILRKQLADAESRATVKYINGTLDVLRNENLSLAVRVVDLEKDMDARNVTIKNLRDACQSALDTAELMMATDPDVHPPWHHNPIMCGVVKGLWLTTPTRLRQAIAEADEILT